MANWTGSLVITAGCTGTVSSATSTTLTNSGASFPGSNALANYTVRILTGTGSGQERIITTNTSTQVTVTVAWTTNPDSSSTYEIVLIFKDQDHITGSLSLGTTHITELADNATILVDGNYSITLTNDTTVRWQKAIGTLVTFCANTRTVTGKNSSWAGIILSINTTPVTPKVEYIKIQDATNPLQLNTVGSIRTNGSAIKHIWIESCGSSSFNTTVAMAENHLQQYIFAKNGSAVMSKFNTTTNAFNQVYERFWVENGLTGGFMTGSAGATLQVGRDSVFKLAQSNQHGDVTSSHTFRVEDCYISSSNSGDGAIVMSNASTGATGAYQFRRNTSNGTRTVGGLANAASSTMDSGFNDMFSQRGSAYLAINIAGASNYGTATSDNDYLAGTNNASLENVDTSLSTTSTATPTQYQNLTATRTNAKSVRNKPLTCNNVVAGTPTDSAVTVTFDCTNGVVSGQGNSTVNSDSASGQTTLNIASSTGFQIGEIIEIGYGTARYEAQRIATIPGATSVTLESNLTFSHTAAQADVVQKQLRHMGLPFIRYGTATGVYNMRTDIPDPIDWGLVFTNIKTSINGTTYAWNKLGHSISVQNLKPETTYYAVACAYNPLEEELQSTEFSFTTAAFSGLPSIGNVKTGISFDNGLLTGTYTGSDRWTDPGVANVRFGTVYKVNSTTNNSTGTLDLPQVATVLVGVTYDSTSKTGTYNVVAKIVSWLLALID